MKYEIIKGSEKDFEGLNDGVMRVFKSATGSLLYSDVGTFVGAHWNLIAERRLITEPVFSVEWLPPVGIKVDVISDTGNSIVVEGNFTGEVISHIEDYAIVRMHWGLACFKADRLLPSRSPEDVARDEAIAEMRIVGYTLPAGIVFSKEEMAGIYDAIAAGKIKGVVLDSSTADLKINITTEEMWREFEKKSDMEDVRKLMMDSLAEQRVAFNKSRHSSF